MTLMACNGTLCSPRAVIDTMERRRSSASRSGLALLSVASLALIAPALALQPGRGAAESATSKETLYLEEIGGMLASLPGAAGDGRDLQTEILAASGGWSGEEMPWTGSGSFTVAPGTAPAPDPERRVVTVMVRAEEGIPVQPEIFAEQVMGILNDPRGWGEIDAVSFARTDVDAEADIVVTLASPATTELLCGELPTNGYTSCGRGRPVNINAARWVDGAAAFAGAGGSIEDYRVYVINHEVGHSLSHGHEQCPAPGAVAPVMLQQTLTVGQCVPNGWPNP